MFDSQNIMMAAIRKMRLFQHKRMFVTLVLLCVISLYTYYGVPITKFTRLLTHKSTPTKNVGGSRRTNYVVSNLIPNVKVEHISCRKLMANDSTEMTRAESFQNLHPKVPKLLSYFINATQTCAKFKQDFHYTTVPLSAKEEEFPLAYTLVIHKDIEQVERLLRAIYRPQNYYCIHVDMKVDTEFRTAMKGIASCFDNVFLSSRSVDLQWGRYSNLEPQLICMEDLWKYKLWKKADAEIFGTVEQRYYINLTGQEFPLQTNGDIVDILRAVKGANLAGATIKRRNMNRFEKALIDQPPASMRLVKGSIYVVVKREFVDYVLHNETALKFRDWIKDTPIPDEGFFSTLIHNPQLQIPGSYLGEPEVVNPEQNGSYPFLPKFVNWLNSRGQCHGQNVRTVCVFGVRDLPLLYKTRELFVNKLYLTFHPLAYDCLEELHYNKTRDSVLGLRTFDASYYSNLDVTKHHVN